MFDIKPPQASETETHDAAPDAPRQEEMVFSGLSQQIDGLASSSDSAEHFYQRLFKLLVSQYRPLAAVLQAQFDSSYASDEFFSPDLTDNPEAMRVVLDSFLDDVQSETGSVARQVTIDRAATMVSIPLFTESAADERGAVAFVFDRMDAGLLRIVVAELYASMATAQLVRPRLPAPAERHVVENRTFDAICRSARYESTRELAYVFVNQLCDRFDCEQIGFGIAESNRIEVLAVSGIANFKASSPGVMDLRQAMEECFDFGETIVCQQQGETIVEREFAIHRQWAESTRSVTCSIPLFVNDRRIGIISLRRSKRKPFAGGEIAQLKDLVEPFGPAVQLLRKSERKLRRHLVESSQNAVKSIAKPKSIASRIVVAAVAILAFWFCLGTVAYEPSCVCTVTPSNLTHVLTPFDMKLSKTLVRSGDRVKKGQLLAQFDTRELDLQKLQLQAEIEKAEVEVRDSIATDDVPNAALARANVRLLRAKLATIESKIERCRIIAESDGMVVSANLDKSLGQVFPQGKPVLTFAPMDKWELVLEIPERDASHFRTNLKGTFAAYAHPHQKVHYELTQISGSASVSHGKNVFHATATVENAQPWMRMGQEGIAKTDTGSKAVWWVALHRLIENAQLSFWL